MLGDEAENALRGEFRSKKSWDGAMKRGFARAAAKEAYDSVGSSNTAATYMVYMEVMKVPYYL